MFFDITKDGKLTFFDKLSNPVAKFDNIKDAENFIQGIKPSMNDYWIVKQLRCFKMNTFAFSSLIDL